MESWIEDIEYERLSVGAKLAKKILINPLANYLPAGLLKGLLAKGQSELAIANWRDPGGWRSMVISYQGDPPGTWEVLKAVQGGVLSRKTQSRTLDG